MAKFRIRYAFVPACIGFGPLFMVMPSFWHAQSFLDSMTALGGAFMLSFGLYSVAEIVFSELVKKCDLPKKEVADNNPPATH